MGSAAFNVIPPAAMALLTEGMLLAAKLNRAIDAQCGLIWAVCRAIERGEAHCPALEDLSHSFVEETFLELHGPLPAALAIHDIKTAELFHSRNIPMPLLKIVSRNKSAPRSTLVLGQIISDLIRSWDYKHVANSPLINKGLDLVAVSRSLRDPEGVTASQALESRGTIPANNLHIYNQLCHTAQARGEWMISAFTGLDSDGKMVDTYVDNVNIYHLQGDRPWGPSVCTMLGIAAPLM